MGERVAIYCRLSVEDGDLETGEYSESIKNQRLMLTDYAKTQGWTIHEIYCDEDLKGFDRNRPEFKRMIKGAERGDFDIILCKHQSRFTRDMELVEKYINGRFILWGIRFVSLTDHVDTAVKGNKKARQINGLINEWYSEDLSENIRAVLRKKMEDGQYIGSFAPYGYQKSPKDRHKIVIDEEVAEIVREIYRLYLSGWGSSRIAGELTRRGIPTPSAYKQIKGSNYAGSASTAVSRYHSWSPGTIKRILSNEIYTGTLIQGREKKLSYKSKKTVVVPREEWVIIENNHEPIIDYKTFERARAIAKNNRRTAKKFGEETKVPNIFGGKLKCSNCGASLQRCGVSRDGNTVYYRCSAGAKTKELACAVRGIRQDMIERAVQMALTGQIQNFLISNQNRESLAENVLKAMGPDNSKKQTEELTRKIEEIDRVLARAYGDMVLGRLPETAYESCKKVFLEQRAVFEEKELVLKKRKLKLNQGDISKQIDTVLSCWQKQHCINGETVSRLIQSIGIGENENGQKEIYIYWDF